MLRPALINPRVENFLEEPFADDIKTKTIPAIDSQENLKQPKTKINTFLTRQSLAKTCAESQTRVSKVCRIM